MQGKNAVFSLFGNPLTVIAMEPCMRVDRVCEPPPLGSEEIAARYIERVKQAVNGRRRQRLPRMSLCFRAEPMVAPPDDPYFQPLCQRVSGGVTETSSSSRPLNSTLDRRTATRTLTSGSL